MATKANSYVTVNEALKYQIEAYNAAIQPNMDTVLNLVGNGAVKPGLLAAPPGGGKSLS